MGINGVQGKGNIPGHATQCLPLESEAEKHVLGPALLKREEMSISNQ
jgi:hypothetical protein